VRRAYFPAEQEPVIFGVHGAVAEHYKVPEVAVVEGVDEGEMLGLASGVEADSEHPIAKAIVSGAGRQQLTNELRHPPPTPSLATVNLPLLD
jgi:Cu2+-exporting ATPase